MDHFPGMRLIVSWILSYLIGSIPTGLLIAKLTGNLDIREHGSGNIGATNVARVLGKKWGAIVLALDILKGFLPVVILPALFGLPTRESGLVEITIGAAAVLGHCFSIFLGFKGGKGVATAIGVFLAIAPLQIILLTVIGLILIAWKGYVSLASVMCAALLPFFFYFSHQPIAVLLVAEILAAVVILKHWPNMLRLIRGEEIPVWQEKPNGDDGERIPITRDGDSNV
ncbi:MAG: glycerol-3-phosphate 1-O-acyltransferase PlsY [Candidatus Sumerlaeaceae bacterium]